MFEDALMAVVRKGVREELTPVLERMRELERCVAGLKPSSASPLLSVKQAAAHVNVTPSTVRAWIREGRLRVCIVGRVHRVRRDELDALFADASVNREAPEDVDVDAIASAILDGDDEGEDESDH